MSLASSPGPSAPGTIILPAPMLPTTWSIADLQEHLGGIPLSRIRMFPPPGHATEDDAFRIHDQEGVLCELVDGVLVEKDVGAYESIVTVQLIFRLQSFLQEHPIGFLMGADGPVRPRPRKMRLPDVSFLSWSRFPARAVPRDKVLKFAPDLAVEVLSEGNTQREIELKLDEYFAGGTRLAWIIDPERRDAMVYRSRNAPLRIDENGSLDGGDVLPGFKVALRELFDAVPRE